MPNEQNEEMSYQLEAHNSARLDKLERLLEEHIVVCTRQKEELGHIVEFVQNVDASLKVANVMRRVIIWVAGLVAAIYGAYHAYRGT